MEPIGAVGDRNALGRQAQTNACGKIGMLDLFARWGLTGSADPGWRLWKFRTVVRTVVIRSALGIKIPLSRERRGWHFHSEQNCNRQGVAVRRPLSISGILAQI
jgi:hypothetical protein